MAVISLNIFTSPFFLFFLFFFFQNFGVSCAVSVLSHSQGLLFSDFFFSFGYFYLCVQVHCSSYPWHHMRQVFDRRLTTVWKPISHIQVWVHILTLHLTLPSCRCTPRKTSRWQLKYLGPCHPFWRPGLSFFSWVWLGPGLIVAGIWEVWQREWASSLWDSCRCLKGCLHINIDDWWFKKCLLEL